MKLTIMLLLPVFIPSLFAQSLIEELPNDPDGPVVNINGDLLVGSGAFLAFDPIELSVDWNGIPEGDEMNEIVCHGPLQIGQGKEIYYLKAQKSGVRGQKFVLPLGLASNLYGNIEIQVNMQGVAGSNTGSAIYRIAGSQKQMYVSSRTAVGAADRLKLYGIVGRNDGMLSLEFDAHEDPDSTRLSTTTINVVVIAAGNYEPGTRTFSFGWVDSTRVGMETVVLPIFDDFVKGVNGNGWSRSMELSKRTIEADTVVLEADAIEINGDLTTNGSLKIPSSGSIMFDDGTSQTTAFETSLLDPYAKVEEINEVFSTHDYIEANFSTETEIGTIYLNKNDAASTYATKTELNTSFAELVDMMPSQNTSLVTNPSGSVVALQVDVNGDTVMNGQIRLTETQGDISMGVFGE